MLYWFTDNGDILSEDANSIVETDEDDEDDDDEDDDYEEDNESDD